MKMGSSTCLFHSLIPHPSGSDDGMSSALNCVFLLTLSLPSAFSICPGRHFASNSVFITAASVLATLDISQAIDEMGKPIPVDHDVTPSFFS